MKKNLTIFLVMMFVMVGVVSANTFPSDYESSLIAAADRLVEMQNPDGGFNWQVDPGATTGPGNSGFNTLGITAMGILKAHELLDKAEYETALAKAYFYATENGLSHTLYYAFPDVTFLTGLADACVEDASLLAAINTEVSETTIQDIRILAGSIWTNRLADGRYGTTEQGRNFDATQMAEYLFSARGSLAFWDNEAAVKAALALGLDEDAQAIADVMNTHLLAKVPFDIEDTTDVFYALALGGAIGGFSELGAYPTITRTMTDLLIANQYGAGYWDQGGNVTSDKESVQTTTYAVMALIAQGDEDALAAARQGGDWLINTQNLNGGWYPGYVGATKENLEVDSEAAWAIYETIQILDESNVIGVGSDFVALTVPDSIDYGRLFSTPGFETAAQEVTLTNVGSLGIVVTPIWESGAEVFKRIKFSDNNETYGMITDGIGNETVYTTTIDATWVSGTTFENEVTIWTKIKIAMGDLLAKLEGPQSGTIYFQAVEA